MANRLLLPTLGVVIALLGAGCGSGDKAALAPKVSGPLARESDRVAELIAQGDSCGAASEAATLRRNAQRAIADGAVPAALAPTLRARTSRLAASITCVAPAAPARAARRAKHGGEGEGGEHGEGGDD